MELEHPSYPGYYGISLSGAVRTRMRAVAETMIPDAEGFPPSAGIVERFVSEHIAPDERDRLEALLTDLDEAPGEGLATQLRELEERDPELFGLLRSFVYHGYYTSKAFAASLMAQGSDYHGAPQPYGYRIDEEQPVPRDRRGSFIPTEEVRRVSL